MPDLPVPDAKLEHPTSEPRTSALGSGDRLVGRIDTGRTINRTRRARRPALEPMQDAADQKADIIGIGMAARRIDVDLDAARFDARLAR